MGRHIGQPMITTSVKISPEFHALCIKYYISFSEAMRRGIALMLAEKGIIEYQNDLNIVRMASEYKLKAAAYAQKASDIENGNGKTE
jgi:hypothetical protein